MFSLLVHVNLYYYFQKYENSTDNLARVYPYGTPGKKKHDWKYVKNAEEARLAVIESIPDTVLKIKGRDVQDFLFESFTSSPSRFPFIFFTSEFFWFGTSLFSQYRYSSISDT